MLFTKWIKKWWMAYISALLETIIRELHFSDKMPWSKANKRVIDYIKQMTWSQCNCQYKVIDSKQIQETYNRFPNCGTSISVMGIDNDLLHIRRQYGIIEITLSPMMQCSHGDQYSTHTRRSHESKFWIWCLKISCSAHEFNLVYYLLIRYIIYSYYVKWRTELPKQGPAEIGTTLLSDRIDLLSG